MGYAFWLCRWGIDMDSLDLPEYMSDDMLPGGTVLCTPEEVRAYFDWLPKEAGV